MKTIALLISVGLGVASASAQYAGDYEPFSDATGSGGTSYSTGANLAGQANAIFATSGGVGAAWFLRGTMGAQPAVGSAGLSYPGLLTSGGGSASFAGGGSSALMALSTGAIVGGSGSGIGNDPNLNNFGVTADTVFFSYLLKLTDITGLSETGAGITSLNQLNGGGSGVPGAQGGIVMAKSDVGGFNIGLDIGGKATTPASAVYDSAVYTSADTLFIVGMYYLNDPVAQNDAQAKLWINPDSSSFGLGSAPTADINIGSSTVNDLSRISSVLLLGSAGGPTSGAIDDLRVGLSWADVTPLVPEPSASVLGVLGLVMLCGRRFLRK